MDGKRVMRRRLMLVGVALRGRPPRVVDLEAYRARRAAEAAASARKVEPERPRPAA